MEIWTLRKFPNASKIIILECLNNGGTVVAPVFSLGRSQEILYELKCMQDEGSLDPNIPIYFDGKLAIRYTLLYIRDGLDIKRKYERIYAQKHSVCRQNQSVRCSCKYGN